jgi:chemotaxis signal transduction protein
MTPASPPAPSDLPLLLRHMDSVQATRESLHALQGAWDMLAMLGQMSGTGVEIGAVRAAFGELSAKLQDQLGLAARRKAALAQRAKAQTAIDILVRNLFERTADIGFLATDDDLRQFAEATPAERDSLRAALRTRLREYQRKYSVYDDIVLLTPQGELIARLDEEVPAPTRCDGFVQDALRTSQAYVEYHGPSALRPGGEPVLIYAYRVMAADGRRVIAVLALSFRLADEAQRIFEGLTQAGDWSVMALLDATGRVLASSDALQLPIGATLEPQQRGEARLLRFAGRRWLATSCDAHAYQGYTGPGWLGHAMLPLSEAFSDDEPAPEQAVSAAVQRALTASATLFPPALLEIPQAAERIESELIRAVWNGNVALAGQGQAGRERDVGFSKTLMREIGRTGTRTRERFMQAIASLNRTVVSSTLDEARMRAALAIDVMDRNLYERANDARWWALTGSFRRALEQGSPDAAITAQLTRTLQGIHALYTVYADLVLFDRHGRVVAVSRDAGPLQAGSMLEADWVRRTLVLPDAQAYAVSAFEPSALYGERATYIYTAAVRGLADPRSVVGGIAIVFDAAPQFEAMLHDTLPRDEQGTPRPGTFGAFIERDGRVIASAGGQLQVGERLTLDLATLKLDAPRGGSALLTHEGRLYAVGAQRSSGYREYKSAGDSYRNEVIALSFLLLADAEALAVEPPVRAPALAPQPLPGRDEAVLELATFAVQGQWYALPAAEVAQALAGQRILPLPGHSAPLRGGAMWQSTPIAVIDLAHVLHGHATPGAVQGKPIVVLRGAADRPGFGLLVDALGDTPEVARSRLDRLVSARASADGLIEQVVKPAPGSTGQPILMLLSAARLATLVGQVSLQP